MKPFGQPVTEIFDFEEGSRFAALTVIEGLNKAKQDCSQGMSSRSSLTKAYAGFITFNLEVKEIAKAYNQELGSVEKLGLLVSQDIASSELRICSWK